MQMGIDENILILKLDNNEDFFKSLNNAISTNNINSGIILTGIGMLKDIELGYFDPKGYKTKVFKKPHELISMSGSIAYEKNNISNVIPHIHCSIGDENHRVWGGHLIKAKVNVINEITILKLPKLNLNRIKNYVTGLMELNLKE